MRYSKPFLTFDEQLELLKSRGLTIVDEARGVLRLSHIGYNRLRGYLEQWCIISETATGDRVEQYEAGRSLEDAIALYSFDRRLRLDLLDAIERIEVALKVQIAYALGKHGPLAYLDQAFLGQASSGRRPNATDDNFQYLWRKNREFVDGSSESIAKRMRDHYDGDPPVWVATELWDLGLLCHVYDIMTVDDRIEVATALRVPTYIMLASWMGGIRHVRNICAHHSQLYRRSLTHRVGLKDMKRSDELRHLTRIKDDRRYRLYPTLSVIAYLMRTLATTSEWNDSLRNLLDGFPETEGSSLADYGFPEAWEGESLWNGRLH